MEVHRVAWRTIKDEGGKEKTRKNSSYGRDNTGKLEIEPITQEMNLQSVQAL